MIVELVNACHEETAVTAIRIEEDNMKKDIYKQDRTLLEAHSIKNNDIDPAIKTAWKRYDKNLSKDKVIAGHPMSKKRNKAKSNTLSQPSGGEPMNMTMNGTCRDRLCSSLISSVHHGFFKRCESYSFHVSHIEPASIPVRCHFQESKGHSPVALVSVPGSGNTWVRGLLEKATGICTGSIYCDFPLRIKGFVGENVHDGSVLVVKTHTSDYQWEGALLEKRNSDDALYSSAILLLRNPFDTFVSEWNRIKTLDHMHRKWQVNDNSHVNEVGGKEFGKCLRTPNCAIACIFFSRLACRR